MTTPAELSDAVHHIGRVTGDPKAWTLGLTPQDIGLFGLLIAPPAQIAAVLNKIRANHPDLFDPRTGNPVMPKAAPVPPTEEGQQGAGVTAIKKAEGDLAHQNSATAQLDLLVVTAILNAHTITEQGNSELQRLQAEIEQSVRQRTDLDTPAGARDFQRYLIDKLREIGAVVQSASLDDRSKAALAGAWTALYESSKEPTSRTAETAPAAAAEPSSSASGSSDPPPSLPPYGADLGPDPLLDQLLAQESFGTAASPPPTSPTGAVGAPAPAPAATQAPAFPGLPTLGGAGAGLPTGGTGWPRAEDDSMPPARAGEPDNRALDELLAEAESVLAEDPEAAHEDEDEAEDDRDTAAEDSPADPGGETAPESSEVRLPNGDVITAASPQLAQVITTALGGTPVGEAFHRHGLTIAPPGTPVADPVDPAAVSTGDVGMFTDHQALALDRTRALLRGEIQPLASVSGPSFLGWMHPPQQPDTAPAAVDPAQSNPAPTRPATTPAT